MLSSINYLIKKLKDVFTISENKKYITFNTRYEILDYLRLSLPDSFVKNKIGKGSGEAKLYVGQYNEEYHSFFDYLDNDFFFLKSDINKYLFDARNEFLNPKQDYRDKNSVMEHYENALEFLNNQPNEILKFKMFRKGVEPPRVYLQSDSEYYNLIRDIGLPNTSHLLILKLKSFENIISYYCIINFDNSKKFSRNRIFFGAPGTGKSYELNEQKNELLGSFTKNYERVTFHPDYSYANFVGTYKPIPKKDEHGKESITYKYIPGPFLRILTKAIKYPSEPFLLIIEEINRANVAAVFGDVFQLLDRKKDYCSEYPIDISEDMKKYFKEVEIMNRLPDEKLFIPKNMFIWATMNSSDQGVFFMDTAFKRRWDFKHIDINNNDYKIQKFKFKLENDKIINWNSLRKSINSYLLDEKINEDKCLGPFFINIAQYESEILDEDFINLFKNKVLMYLFEDAGKSKRDYLFEGSKDDNDFTYSKICKDFDSKGINIFNSKIIREYKSIADKNEE